MKLVTQFLSTD